MKNDPKSICFRNFERRPLIEEYEECVAILKENGCIIGELKDCAVLYLAKCSLNGKPFEICVEDETLLRADSEETIEELLSFFET